MDEQTLVGSIASSSSSSDSPPKLPPPDGAAVPNDHGCCLKVLVAMCYGICINDKPLLAIENAPWSNIPIAQVRPNQEYYAKEVGCLWAHLHVSPAQKTGPRPRAWSLAKIQEWFEQNPIINLCNIPFLRATVIMERKRAHKEASREVAEENKSLGAGN